MPKLKLSNYNKGFLEKALLDAIVAARNDLLQKSTSTWYALGICTGVRCSACPLEGDGGQCLWQTDDLTEEHIPVIVELLTTGEYNVSD